MDATQKINMLVSNLILADRAMQRKGLIWGDQYEEMSHPIRAARKALDDALEANEQTLASKEAELVRLREALGDLLGGVGECRTSLGQRVIDSPVGVKARQVLYSGALTQPPKEPT